MKRLADMKRALGLIITIIACVAAFLSVRGVMPFMPVFGNSMEPTLQAGNLILIEKVSPSEIEVGDVIVFNVPTLIRDYYSYPPVIAHRVLKVNTERGINFRTQGDNTGEDPFATRASDVRGKVGRQIPALGFPLLFFQSQQGLVFVIIALSLLTFYLYMDELTVGRRKVHEGIFAPVIRDNRRHGRVIERRTEQVERGMTATQRALEQFAGAIAEYAQHLKSHTSAIQSLSEASHELKNGAAEQNKILTRLVERMEQAPAPAPAPAPRAVPVERETPKREEVAPQAKGISIEVRFPPGCIKSRQQQQPTTKGGCAIPSNN